MVRHDHLAMLGDGQATPLHVECAMNPRRHPPIRRSLLALLTVSLVLAGLPTRGLEAQAAPGPERRVALVVGNNAYGANSLINGVRDARAMEGALLELGFQVERLEDVGLERFNQGIERFIGRIRQGDAAFFYYSGHGLQIGGENYLVPVGFQAGTEVAAKYRAVPADMIRERMEEAGAQVSVVVLDACRDNPYRQTRSMGRGLAAMQGGRGALVAFATAPGKTASDNSEGQNGLFTHYLLTGMRMPGLDIGAVFDWVREQVDRASNHTQVPWVASSVIGKFYIRESESTPQASQVPQAAPLETPLALHIVPNPPPARPQTSEEREAESWRAAQGRATELLRAGMVERGDLVWTVQDNAGDFKWRSQHPSRIVEGANWFEAVEYCQQCEVGGYSDWRLPTIDELRTLYHTDGRKTGGRRLAAPFDARAARLWSSTKRSATSAWAFSFDFQKVIAPSLEYNELMGARCVRRAGR